MCVIVFCRCQFWNSWSGSHLFQLSYLPFQRLIKVSIDGFFLFILQFVHHFLNVFTVISKTVNLFFHCHLKNQNNSCIFLHQKEQMGDSAWFAFPQFEVRLTTPRKCVKTWKRKNIQDDNKQKAAWIIIAVKFCMAKARHEWSHVLFVPKTSPAASLTWVISWWRPTRINAFSRETRTGGSGVLWTTFWMGMQSQLRTNWQSFTTKILIPVWFVPRAL